MHGYAAYQLGDHTAKYAGRLTLNPIPHIDVFGSIILPFLTVLSTGFYFGWAKPVPYNPYNFVRMRTWGEAIVAAAGPLSNLAIAATFALIIRSGVMPSAHELWGQIVIINVSLMLLNLIPIPPLDGSKILPMFLPLHLRRSYDGIRAQLEYNPFMGMGLVLLFVMLLGGAFGNLVYSIAQVLLG